MLKNLNSIIDLKDKIRVLFIILALTLSSLLDIVGITLIPILATSLLSDPSIYLDTISSYSNILNLNYLSDLGDKERIKLLSTIIVILFISKNFFLIITYYFEGKILEIISLKNSKKLFKKYLINNYLFHIYSKPVLLARNIVVENQAIKTSISSFLHLFKEIFLLIGITLILFLTNWKLTLLLVGSLTFLVSIYLFFIKKNLEKRGKLNQEIRGFQINFLNQGFRSIKEIIFFNKQKYLFNIFDKKNDIFEKNILFVNILNKLPRIILEISTIVIIVVVGLILILDNKPVSEIIGVISLVTAASIRLIPSYNLIVSSISRIQFIKPSVDLVKKELDNYKINNEIFNKDISKKKLEFKNELVLKNVNFEYPETKNNIFENLNFTLKKGDQIGILGPSGSGKTTFINLISGLIDPTRGQIIIDDEFLIDKKKEWFNSIGYVGQEIFLIDDTIKNNIAFGLSDEEIDMKNLLEALKISGLENFKDKLESNVGENGSKLSGGQKQRIGIARAIYRKPKILILDEATNALDKVKESEIINSIFNSYKDLTVLMISHDIQSLKKCKKIINFDKGKITD